MITSMTRQQFGQFAALFGNMQRTAKEELMAEMALCEFLGIADEAEPRNTHMRLMAYTPETYLMALGIGVQDE